MEALSEFLTSCKKITNVDKEYKQVKIEQPKDKEIYLRNVIEDGVAYQDKSHSLTASYNGAVFWNSIIKKQRTMIPIKLGNFNKGGQGTEYIQYKGNLFVYLLTVEEEVLRLVYIKLTYLMEIIKLEN